MSRPTDKRAAQKTKVLMWAAFLGLLCYSAWAGSNTTKANAAAQTSTTRTVTVNATVSPAIELYVSTTNVTLNVTTPGSAVEAGHDIQVRTNSETGYKLWQKHNQNLTHTDASTIIDPDWNGTVDAPTNAAATGNGLGFSLCGADVVEAIWNTGDNWSTFAATATEANNYACYAAANTTINVFYRLDVKTTQKSGSYTNEVEWYAVTNGT